MSESSDAESAEHHSPFGTLDYSGESVFETDSFSEWIENIAQSTGQSTEEILQQLIAASWRLTELTIENTDSSIDRLQLNGENGLSGGTSGHSSDPTRARMDDVVSQLDEIRAEVTELREQIAEINDESADTEEVQNLQQMVHAHEEAIADLTDRYDSLAEIEATATQALEHSMSLSDAQNTLRRKQNEVQADHDSLREKLNDELSNARTILAYLIETTEQTEASIEALQAAHKEEISTHKRLVELKNAALQFDIDTAECANCGREFELQALASPDCPQCGRRFSLIKQDSRWFGLIKSNQLVTTDR